MERTRAFDYIVGASNTAVFGALAVAILLKPEAGSSAGSSPNFGLVVIAATAAGGIGTCMGNAKGLRVHKIAGFTLSVLLALAAAFTEPAIVFAGGASFALAGAIYALVRESQVLAEAKSQLTFAAAPPVQYAPQPVQQIQPIQDELPGQEQGR